MRGHVRKRGGKWAFVIELGKDGTGRRRQKWHSGYATEREAENALADAITRRNAGTYIEPHKLTLGAFLERFLTDYARPKVAPKTYERYAEILDAYVIPRLGARPLAKLTPLDLQTLYRELGESGRCRRAGGGLSAMSVLHVHRILHTALAQAVRWGLVARNVVEAAQPPRPQRAEMRALDEADALRLIEASRGTGHYLPVVLALTTGLRRGEIFGLRWEDLDLEARTLTVQRSLDKTRPLVDGRPTTQLAVKAPKTAKGRRVVTLLPLTIAALKAHRAEQTALRLRLGLAALAHAGGFVLARPDGSPLDPDTATQNFARLVRKATLPRLRFHDLRHSHASMLLKAGVGVRVVADRLGHATPTLTLNTYAHVLAGQDADAAAKLEAALRGTK